MYEEFFGLQERPFDLTPDPRYLYLTPKHSEALAHLDYAFSSRKGITVLTGEVGTGKTVLLRTAMARARGSALRCAHLSNPTLARGEFYEMLTAELGLTTEAAGSKARFLLELGAVIEAQHKAGGVTALVVDEAQGLPVELLEEIRLLANIESDREKLLQVVLVGQPELSDRLNEPALRQLKQRVALRCTLAALDLRETASYIAGRVRIAGGDPSHMFTRGAVEEVFSRSKGIPRLISVICDNALVTGFALGVRPVDRHVVLDVCRDFDFDASAAKPPTGDVAVPVVRVSEPDRGATDGITLVVADAAPETAADAAVVEPAPERRFTLFDGMRAGGRS